jgi:hypothetical protein
MILPPNFPASVLAAFERLLMSLMFFTPWFVQFRKHMNVGMTFSLG